MNKADAFLILPDAPSIPGLKFRLFQGEADISALRDVREEVRAVDGNLWFMGPDTDPDAPCDPTKDCLLAEIDGKVIGYTWFNWWTEADGTQLYLHLGWIVPQWRRRGIGRAMLRWQEQRLRQIAQTHPMAGTRIFGGNADETQSANRALLLSEGYQVAFTRVVMICQLPIVPVQASPLPEGLQIRPVDLEQLPAMYAMIDKAFADDRVGHTVEDYDEFLSDLGGAKPDTSLWISAWDGDQIVGLTISTRDAEVAQTPWVAVHHSWRRRGVGKALMTRTIQRFQEQGIRRAEIVTVAENPGRSVHLYESVGYQVVERQPRYRKPM